MLVVAGALATLSAATKAAELSINYNATISPLIIGFIIVSFVLIFALLALDWSRPLRWRWLNHLGALTYPLYLLHAFIGYVVMATFGGDHPDPGFVLGLILMMVVGTWLLHRFGEQPLAHYLKQKLRNSRSLKN